MRSPQHETNLQPQSHHSQAVTENLQPDSLSPFNQPLAHPALLQRFPTHPQAILQLQRQYGNRYVNQVLHKRVIGAATGIQSSAASESGGIIQCVKRPSTKKFRRWLGRHTILPPMGEAGREGRKERKRVQNGQIIPPANVNNNVSNGYSFAELWNMEDGALVLKPLDPSRYAGIKKSSPINEGKPDVWEINNPPYIMQFSPISTCAIVIFIYDSLDHPTKIAVYHATGSTIYESDIKKDADFIIMISSSLYKGTAKNDETDLQKAFQKLGINNKLRVLKGFNFYAVTSDGRVGNAMFV